MNKSCKITYIGYTFSSSLFNCVAGDILLYLTTDFTVQIFQPMAAQKSQYVDHVFVSTSISGGTMAYLYTCKEEVGWELKYCKN